MMRGRSAPAAPFVVAVLAVMAAGCGSSPAPQPGTAVRATAPSTTAPATAPPATAPPGRTATLTITLAGDQKTYHVRVGDKLRVYLRGTSAARWLPPLASSAALTRIPDPAGTLQIGVTGAAFSAVRPGQVTVTSVRPPCKFTVPQAKGNLEPGVPVPTAYPLRYCAPSRRFSVSIIVLR